MPPVIDRIGQVLADRYRLLAPIGAGASGTVYLADDARLRRRVAVKVLHPALADDAGFLRRFRTEAQVAASLHHPNVMGVYDWGDDETPFMVLELLEGGSLRAVLDTGVRLTPAQAAHVGRQVCAALEYAHGRGLVHRDVKPANLIFDEHGVVRVADFGLARALAEASWTEPAGALLGTARYASPEQARGLPLDARSDLYSLALVLVEAVTGSVPFTADTPLGTLAARLDQSLIAPASLSALAPVLERAGQRDPTDRYADAATMGRALRDAQRLLPVPGGLPLAGMGEASADAHPTSIGSNGRVGAGALPATNGRAHDVDADRNGHRLDDRPRNGANGNGQNGHAPNGHATNGQAVVTTVRRVDARRAVREASDLPPRLYDQEAPSEPIRLASRPTRRRARWIGALVVMALVGAGGYLYSTRPTGPKVVVPKLVTQDEASARQAAEQTGLTFVVDRRVPNDAAAGVVIEQRPDDGKTLRKGAKIHADVSAGPPMVAIPPVTGVSLDAATTALREKGFGVDQLPPEFNEFVPLGNVIATEPTPGAEARKGSRVQVHSSAGPPPRTLPELSGQSYDAAAAELSKLGLAPVRQEEFSDSVELGLVTRLDPASGQQANRGDPVNVYVSKGPDLVAVPKTVGTSIEDASRSVRNAGFRVGAVSNYTPSCVVASQRPGSGKAKRGSKIDLSCG